MIVIGYVMVVIVAVIRGGGGVICVGLIIVSFGLEEHLALRLQLHGRMRKMKRKQHKNG